MKNIFEIPEKELTQRIINYCYENEIFIKEQQVSLDICQSYFRTNKGNLSGEHLEESCIRLYAYLGSCGLLHSNSCLMKISPMQLTPIIDFANDKRNFYCFELKNNVEQIRELYCKIKECLSKLPIKPTKMLITAIMCGIFSTLLTLNSDICCALGISGSNDLSVDDINKIFELIDLANHIRSLLSNNSNNKIHLWLQDTANILVIIQILVKACKSLLDMYRNKKNQERNKK